MSLNNATKRWAGHTPSRSWNLIQVRGGILIKNFGDFQRDVFASVNDDMIFYDYAEPEFTIRGNAEIQGTSLTLYYTSAEPDFVVVCTANCLKQ